MPNQLTYLYRLSKGEINYGPCTITVTTEVQHQTSVEVYEYCHESNISTSEFSMTNEVSVSGVVDVFDVGGSSAQTFATTATKATETGQDITTYESEFVSEKEEVKREVPDGSCLVHYVQVDLLCFTVNGGKRQYCHVPYSDTIIEAVDEKDLTDLSNGRFYMDKGSWEIVTTRYPSIKLDDIDALARELDPLPMTVDEFEAMGRVGIRNISSDKCLDGRAPGYDEVFITGSNPYQYAALRWKIEKVEGNYALRSIGSNKYLDGRTSKYAGKNGALLVTDRTPMGDSCLQWKIEKVGSTGYYSLLSLSSDCYVDGRNAGYSGNQVWLSPSTTDPSTHVPFQWKIYSLEDGL